MYPKSQIKELIVLSIAVCNTVIISVLFAESRNAGGAEVMRAQVFAASEYQATCESFFAPASIKAGEPISVTATFKNTGTASWDLAESREQANGVKLAPADGSDLGGFAKTLWYPSRVVMPNTVVAPNQTVTFSFIARAPMVPGVYRSPQRSGQESLFGWKLLAEGVTWFGAACGADITVTPSSDGSIASIDSNGLVTGFAFDPQSNTESIEVHLYLDRQTTNTGGIFIGSAKADQPSPVFNATKGITGNHKFFFSIPAAYRDGKPHQLYIRAIDREGNGSFPIGSPMTFTLSGGASGTPLPKSAALQYFGYYYSANTDDYREESKDFTNISMVNSYSVLSANAAAGIKNIFHVPSNICPPNSTIPSCAPFPTEEAAMNEFKRQFDLQVPTLKTHLDPNGDKNTADSRIFAFYFPDEPILNSITNSQIAAASQYIKDKIAAEGLSPAIPIMLVESAPGLGFVTRPRVKGIGESGPPEYCDQPTDATRNEPDPDAPPSEKRRREKCTAPLRIPPSIDWIGYNAYGVVDVRTDTEWMNAYERLKSRRSSPAQKIVLIPDAWWHYCNHSISNGTREPLDRSIHKEISKNYYELAKSDPSVAAMIGWVWYSYPDDCSGAFPYHKQPSPHSIGMRDMPRAVLDENIRIGQEITGKTGTVIKPYVVRNSNGTGSGSLREAVSKGFRYVTFELPPGDDGIIEISNEIEVRGPHITIDASAVPAPGITLKGAGLKIRGDNGAHNVTVKNIRVRDAAEDGIQISAGAHTVVLDHVSIQGSADGNLDITGAGTRDVTVQNSIIVAPRPDTDQDDKDNEKNMLLGNGATDIRLYKNLIGFANQRNPEISFDAKQDLSAGDFFDTDSGTTVDMRNNIIWNWEGTKPKGQRGTRVERGSRVNLVNNLFGGAPDHAEDGLIVCDNTSTDHCGAAVPNPGSAFAKGNRFLDTALDLNGRGKAGAEFPVRAPGFSLQTPCIAAAGVRAQAGARPLDPVDDSFVADAEGCPPFNQLFVQSAKWSQVRSDVSLAFSAKVYNHSNVAVKGGSARLKIGNSFTQTIPLPEIAPGFTKTVRWSGAGLPPGSYPLRFCINGVETDPVVPDPDESENCLKGTLNVGRPLSSPVSGVDLIAEKVILNASLKNGAGTIKTQIRAKNQGTANAPLVLFKYTVNAVPVEPAFPARALPAGRKTNAKSTWRSTTTPKKHAYSFCADLAPGAVTEGDRSNNCTSGFLMLVDTAVDPLVATQAQFTADLSVGARGAEVARVQAFLSEELLFEGTPTGFLGSVTQNSIREFQVENELAPTGIWDASTRALANEIHGFGSNALVLPPPPSELPALLPPPPANEGSALPPPPAVPTTQVPPPPPAIGTEQVIPPPSSGTVLSSPASAITIANAAFINTSSLKIGGEAKEFSLSIVNSSNAPLSGISWKVWIEQGNVKGPEYVKQVTCGKGYGIIPTGSCTDRGRVGAAAPLGIGPAIARFEIIDPSGVKLAQSSALVTLVSGNAEDDSPSDGNFLFALILRGAGAVVRELQALAESIPSFH